jgi:hypothetical protein
MWQVVHSVFQVFGVLLFVLQAKLVQEHQRFFHNL